MLMSFLGAIGTVMDVSGLRKFMATIYARMAKPMQELRVSHFCKYRSPSDFAKSAGGLCIRWKN